MFYLSLVEFSSTVLPSTVDFIAKNVIVDHITADQGLLATPNERFERNIKGARSRNFRKFSTDRMVVELKKISK